MKTKKQLKFRLALTNGLLFLVAVLGVGLGAKAYTNNSSSQPATVIEHISGNVTINASGAVQTDVPQEQTLGAFNPNNIISNHLNVNGDDVYHVVQTFIDASTTIASVPDPFLKATSTLNDVVLQQDSAAFGWTGATATVELAKLSISGPSTSTYKVFCASAPNPYVTSSLSYSIIETGVIPTSTIGVVENNLAATLNQGIGGGSTSKIMLTPSLPYLICNIKGTGSDGFFRTTYDDAFTNAANTFDGKLTLRISRQH